MKIFNELKELRESLIRHREDYNGEYCGGYLDAINDLEERIKGKIKVEVKE